MLESIFKKICTSMAVVAVSATASLAAVYDATNVRTGGTNGNDHTFYFGSAPFGGGNQHWQFVGGVGTFETTGSGVGSTATLTGTIFQNSPLNMADPENRFDVNLSFTQVAGPANGMLKCGGGCGDSANWDHYVFGQSTLTGVGGTVSGLVLGLYDRATKANGQLGFGANDKDSGFGFSDWFDWSVETANGKFGLTVGDGGHGDVNLQLAPVPLPAGGLLLLSGLAGMGVVRRFRKR